MHAAPPESAPPVPTAVAAPPAAVNGAAAASVPAARAPCGNSGGAAPARLHDLPLPITWDLCGAIRRIAAPPLADTLLSIFEEAVCRTMLHEALPDRPRRQRAVESWIRAFAPLRHEWLEVAHDAVGCAGITPLRVEALALARGAAVRERWDRAVRADLEAALGDAGRVLSCYGVFARERPSLDHRRLRRLSTRFDFCVAAALLAETEIGLAGLRAAAPLLCTQARLAIAELRQMVDSGSGSPAPAPHRPPARRDRTT